MIDLGYILVAFICSTPIDTPDGHHKCYSGSYGWHATVSQCRAAGKEKLAVWEQHGLRLVAGVCRTPLPDDVEYEQARKEKSF